MDLENIWENPVMTPRCLRVYILLLMLSVPVLGAAQTAVTSLHGTIYDSQGAVITTATVTIVRQDIGFTLDHKSNGRGEFSFEQIPPGRYTISATAPGFGKATKDAELLVNEPSTMDFTMTAADQVTVVVDTTAPVLNTTDATIGTPFDSAEIQALPFEGNNIMDLLSLQGGVLFLGDDKETSGSDTREGAIDGARSDQNNITLDGVDNNVANEGYAFTGVLRSTRDSVEEFRVVTTNSNADSGFTSGAQISLVTRSGTNQFHGSGYEYFRPTNTVANDWFLKQSQLLSGLPNRPLKLLRNVYGGSFGAPIKRDKAFFFGAYEGDKIAEDATVTNEVPTASLTSGNLIYENTTTAYTTLAPSDLAKMDPKCSSTGSCPLGPGANPAVLAYFAKFPKPNSAAKGDGYNEGAYVFASPNPQSLTTLIVKFDYTLTSKHRLFARGNLQDDNVLSTLQFPGALPSSRAYNNNKGLAAGDVWTVSSALVNNLRYGFTRPGSSSSGNLSGPYVSFSGVAALNSNTSTTISIVPQHDIVDDLTWTKSRHTLQFGGNYRVIFDNHSSNSTLFNTATIATGNLTTGSIANQGTSLDPGAFGYPAVNTKFATSYNTAIADVTGLITEGTAYANYSVGGGNLTALPAGQVPVRHFFSNEVEYYAQDSWAVKPNLNLTFGIRQALLQVPYERNGQQAVPTIDLNTWFVNRYTAASQGSVNQPPISFTQGGQAAGLPAYWNMDKFDLAPRFAVAWSPNRTLSIRGGYGLYYDHFGDALVDALDTRGSFGLSSSASNGSNQLVDTAPRFSSLSAVPSAVLPPLAAASSFPVTPPNALLTAWVLDKHIKTPYSHVFDVSLEQEMTKGLVFELDYTGRLGRRLLQQLDLAEPLDLVDPKSGIDYYSAATTLEKEYDQGMTAAQIPTNAFFDDVFPLAASGGKTPTQNIYTPFTKDRGNETAYLFNLDTNLSPGSPTGVTYRFFNPQYVNLVGFTSIGTSSYHALHASLHHPMSHGLAFDLNYTFGKSLDIGSDAERVSSAGSRGYGQIISSFNPRLNKAASDFDVRHNVTVNFIGELPYGHGRVFGSESNTFLNTMFGGWMLTSLLHATSGLPFGVLDSTGWSTNYDVKSWMVATAPIQSGGHRLDSAGYPNVFVNPTAALASFRYPYSGETGERNFFRGTGYYSLDSGVDKIFKMHERQQVKFAWEVFNATNTPVFDPKGISNSYSTASSFGRYTSQYTTNAARRMQFSLRYSF